MCPEIRDTYFRLNHSYSEVIGIGKATAQQVSLAIKTYSFRQRTVASALTPFYPAMNQATLENY